MSLLSKGNDSIEPMNALPQDSFHSEYNTDENLLITS